ncbi:transglutaminase-like cysteine peptidase [Kordiimonas pumila]|uniref:Transglutaminase-like cysteine peptidase n=1 Tax=Kordiimonas pumila TaxID=2161677 RepID=A0ABV7D018_9PROT|nr:transglutaminase-like cysteine peptidase [Kordiimonas pumila]
MSFTFFNRIALLLAVLLVQSVTANGAYAQESTKWSLFGSMEIPSTNMKAFGKWTEMWRRYNLPRREEVAPETVDEVYKCRGRYRARCNREAWETFLGETDTSDFMKTLADVNHYMNRSPYIVDPVNWGIPDYWATPNEFFMKDGDCEDYAISKYVTLKRLGFDTSKMRVVILQDENLRAAHAILAVEYDGEIYILDNQVDAVLPQGQILHYRPVYSINETGWWLHKVKRFTQ